jgi:hypothetical protein
VACAPERSKCVSCRDAPTYSNPHMIAVLEFLNVTLNGVELKIDTLLPKHETRS